VVSTSCLEYCLQEADELGDGERPLPCVIQDPGYSTLEQKYLESLGLEVVLDPDIFSKIQTDSLVYSIGTHPSVAWWVSDGIWPRAMITGDWLNMGSSVPTFCRELHPSQVRIGDFPKSCTV
jgi:hypothetical protein